MLAPLQSMITPKIVVVAVAVVSSVPALALSACASAAPPTPPVTAPAAKPTAPANLAKDVVDAKAMDIVKRGTKVAAGLESIDLVTTTKFEGVPAEEMPAGAGGTYHVVLQWPHKDVLSLPRMRVETIKQGGVSACFTHDGSKALFVDPAAKTFREATREWPAIAPFALTALPSWIITERQRGASAAASGSSVQLGPVVLAATITGTETIDGVECDVVRAVHNLDVYADDTGGGKPGIVDAKRMVVVVAYARVDGLPRRISQVEEGTNTSRIVTEFTQVKAAPKLDAATFSTVPPAGFAKQAVAKPAAE